MTSIPRFACLTTTSSTARVTRSENAALSISRPSSRSIIIASRSSGRGRLPTCVVRNLFVLRCTRHPPDSCNRPRKDAVNCSSARFRRQVDSTFELAICAQSADVGKRQHLGHEHGGYTPRRINPVIGVEKTAPSKAAGAAAVRNRFHVDQMTKAPFAGDVRKQVDVVGELWLR